MTREEAIVQIKGLKKFCEGMADSDGSGSYVFSLDVQAIDIALSALRPVSREQVEKSWAGCEYCEKHKINLVRIEMNYNDSPGSPKRLNPTRVPKFCPMCGSPLTDEAVDIVIERLKALKES